MTKRPSNPTATNQATKQPIQTINQSTSQSINQSIKWTKFPQMNQVTK
jgi:hypothetical protein